MLMHEDERHLRLLVLYIRGSSYPEPKVHMVEEAQAQVHKEQGVQVLHTVLNRPVRHNIKHEREPHTLQLLDQAEELDLCTHLMVRTR